MKPKTKFTPGPWMIHARIKDSVVSAKGGPIADMVGTKSSDEHETVIRSRGTADRTN